MNNNYIGALYDEFDNDRFEREDRTIDFYKNKFNGGINIMKSTGIVRKVDELGRVVLPIELRRTMNINEGDSLEIFVDGDTIILRKYSPGCSRCGETKDIVEIDNIRLCRDCGQVLINKFKR